MTTDVSVRLGVLDLFNDCSNCWEHRCMVMNFNALLNIHGYISVPQFVLATSKYACGLLIVAY